MRNLVKPITNMNTVKPIVFAFFFFICGQVSLAQRDTVESSGEKSASSLKLSYNSSFIYPGVRAGIEMPFKKIYITKTKKTGRQKFIRKDHYVSANVSWYHHPSFHDNVYITAGYTLRQTGGGGFFGEFSPELGYSRTFLGGTTYQVSGDGTVSVKRMAGYNYALVSLGGGLGYDFSMRYATPIAICYKLNLLTMFPYNNTVYIRPAMELGIIYKPKRFLMFTAKVKRINKNKFRG